MAEDYGLVPPELAVKAMRDNGYRNAAYALAELVDNSIQAGASEVEVLCAETDVFVKERARRNLSKIAVLDNGSGMPPDVLRIALQFGNGTRLNAKTGIGRFGMGLPSASISQCKRVEVWSWLKGPDSAFYTYIDVDEIVAGRMREVPKPEVAKIPKLWRHAALDIGGSGTLVVWSKLDRCIWKTGLTIIKNSEFVVGRMYRQFVRDGSVAIRMAAFSEDTPKAPNEDRFAVANDPGYLMVGTSTPAPYDGIAMFQPDGDTGESVVEVESRGERYPVRIRYSVAKKEVRDGARNAGGKDYGQHAARNIGVSVVREGRELNLDQALVNGYDPRERWWGVEIDFPAALDDLFGVPNNKQEARNFTEIAKNLAEVLSGAKSAAATRDQMEEEGDPRWALVEIIDSIDRRLGAIRNQIKVQTQGSQGRNSRVRHRAEQLATEATKALQNEGRHGESDLGESGPRDERTRELTDVLLEDGIAPEDAHAIAVEAIDMGIKYVLTKGDLEGSAFFTVRPIAGELVVKLNVNHPAYEHLVEALDDDPEALEGKPDDLRSRLEKAALGLRLLLLAWARFEDEQPPQRRIDVQEIRTDWGRYARKFLAATE
jgi:hypothetical protein